MSLRTDLAHPLRRAAVESLPGYLSELAGLVALDSGSDDPDGVNAVASRVTHLLRRQGFAVERVPLDGRGDAVIGRLAGRTPRSRGGRRILLAGHLDTVFDRGTAAARPFSTDGKRAYGPGVSDDKGGLLAGLTATELLLGTGFRDFAELVFLATPDEEAGSPMSRPVTEALAGTADLALALECARENGDLVIARKGVADFHVRITGRAAHAGIEPERGANAALAAANLVLELQALNGRRQGVTVNVGTIRAGTRTNIVSAEACLELEVRSPTRDGMEWAAKSIHEHAGHLAVEGTAAVVTQLDDCPVMEDGPGARVLLARARAIGARLGFAVDAAATGGVGDANFIAGQGVPVLDGLGPIGGADHTPGEWLDVTSVPDRVALLATLIATCGTLDARKDL
ncbi:M20 family metallopeptidase [Amycolatopsis sp. Hca4]|uniref:M20 family metallopeptidase n=1 Tax=Amycolatopsis sp. Hca4 TaxID=2742131 RepID=UPI001591F067|nr:M20 family metallopeptidase [Amycolatopsis sp. Hca4]QKV73854.1 M20 family metallopeptidase [Amycolatopsis sp. Hca4]